MTFTDDDLKRLKEDMKESRYVHIGDSGRVCLFPNTKLKALLARLACAEAICEVMKSWQENGLAECDLLNDWLESKGGA